jgi:alpha-beta hydrolase superfamily lysophospholipase
MLKIQMLFIVAVFVFFQGCASHFFQPDKVVYRTPDYYGLKYDDINFTSKDGTPLNAWHIYPKEKPSKGLVFVAHGNAQNISAHFVSWVWLVNEGYEIFMFDYRAYGKSEGESSIKGSVEDTVAALDYVDEHYKGKYFACGQSLGGTMLLNALNERDNSRIKAVVIDSTFVGFSDIANNKMSQILIAWPFQWVPYLSITGKYDAKDKLDINLPILYLHGSKDVIISPNASWQLYDVSSQPREFWLVKHTGHTKALTNKNVQHDFLKFLSTDRAYYDANYSSMKIYE